MTKTTQGKEKVTDKIAQAVDKAVDKAVENVAKNKKTKSKRKGDSARRLIRLLVRKHNDNAKRNGQPELTISRRSLETLRSFSAHIDELILREVMDLQSREKNKTITSRDVVTASKLCFTKNLSSYVMNHMQMAVATYAGSLEPRSIKEKSAPKQKTDSADAPAAAVLATS